MDDFKLVQSEVKKAQLAIENTSNQVSSHLRKMQTILETCAASWTGEGAAGFKTAQKGLMQDNLEIRRLLGILHNAVGQTKNLTSAKDIEVKEAFEKANKDAAARANRSGLMDV
ncbi:hypothetical protein I3F58_24170 [Streptomyces sp. MUM 203J]|uniref:WXG100 family type VII secretion target n=1 Tax=Streptomyces sp. MUM 203J TaxID=2791990 RepID=UPI001F039849|nr:hypothetical protein [Streptomyces sp. MUM 203J]MCH0542597.1 hypothetical protein [Streptomyces sp. MUM 203J]